MILFPQRVREVKPVRFSKLVKSSIAAPRPEKLATERLVKLVKWDSVE